jgi:hypothetical protein
MTWTYDATKLNDSPIYQVRFQIGDTETKMQLLQDEEIQFVLNTRESVIAAAVNCCEIIAAKLYKNPDFKLGPYTESASQLAANYEKLALRLRKTLNIGNTPLYTPAHEAVFDNDMMNSTADSAFIPEEEIL